MANLLFHIRGDSLNARYSNAGGTAVIHRGASASDPTGNNADAGSNVLEGKVIQISDASNVRCLMYPGTTNWSGNVGFAIVARIVPRWTGSPAAVNGLCIISKPLASTGTVGAGISLSINTSAAVQVVTQTENDVNLISSTVAGASFTSGTATELVITWDGSGTASSCKVYQNGSLLGSLTPAAAITLRNNLKYKTIAVGISHNGAVSQFDLNEFAIYDGNLTAGEVSTLWSRSTWISSSAFDGSSYSDPGIANVRSGTAYTYAGSSQTGTLATPSLSNVKTGVAGDGGVGTYDGSDRWTDPGESNVREGTAYKANSTTNNRLGTLSNPSVPVLEGDTQIDPEFIMAEILAVMQGGLNDRLSAITDEKDDDIDLAPIDEDAYFFQELNGKTVNFDPFVLYAIQSIKGEGSEGYTQTQLEIAVVVCLEDQGQDEAIGRRILRYGRALRQLFEDNFQLPESKAKVVVASQVPVEISLLNSSNSHRAIGVTLQVDLG